MINTLFTSVGRRVELLRAFRRAYEALALDGNIIAVDIDPLAPALQAADATYIVPRVTSPDYIPALVSICQRERVGLVFPLIDPDMPVLAENRAQLEATGARLAVVPANVAALTADKWCTTQFFRELGVAAPGSWLPADLDPAALRYPVFVKPRFGSAGKSAFKAQDERELAFFLDYVSKPIVQEFLPGPEITSDVICDLDGQVLAVISRQRIEVRWGEVAKGVTIQSPAITEACVRIAEALQACGPITVQCMMKDGEPHFTEINARLGGGTPLSIAAGADFPKWLLAKAAGIHVEIPALGAYRAGLYLTRFDDAFYLSEADRAALASHTL